jgi:ATP-dependent DNA helicase RecQ
VTKQDAGNVKKQLHQLKALGVIQYVPQKEAPQIYFLNNRAPAQSLFIDQKSYLTRKQQYALRVGSMLEYLDTGDCRSRYISAYFGDKNVKDCGICDVCLDRKKSSI